MSNSSALNVVLATLPRLSQTEITKVKAFLQLGGEEIEDDYLLNGIIEELKSRGLIAQSVRPSSKHVKQQLPSNYRETSAEVRAVFDRYLPKNLRPVERLAFGKIVAETLADYMLSWSNPVQPSLKTLASCIRHAPAALDSAFPDYLRFGWLFMIIKRHGG